MRVRVAAMFVLVAGCSDASPTDRQQRVLDTLADDNYMWSLREPALVARKLHKMQRGPYEWLRGTAGLYWRDLTEPGGARMTTAFGDPASSRVLLVGDPHPENVGTFRASDGTMFADWNDLDAAGYGPFTADVWRLATGLIIAAASDDAYAVELATRVAAGYTSQIAAISSPSPTTACSRTRWFRSARRQRCGSTRRSIGTVRILVLNEVAPGETPDWFEVVNATTAAVQLADFVYVDVAGDFAKAKAFPQMMLGPGARYVQDVDDTISGFKLAGDEELWIYRASDHALSDGVDWAAGGAPTGMSYARSPDVFGPFVTGAQTRGAANP